MAYSGRLEDAVALAQRSADEAAAAGSAVDAARAEAAAMHPLAKLGRMDEATRRGERAVAALAVAGQPLLAARAGTSLANILRLTGRTAEALAALEAAGPALRGDPGVFGQVESLRGETLLVLGRLDEAESAFRSAHEQLTRADAGGPGATGAGAATAAAPTSFAAALVLGNLADLHARAGRAQEALDAFDAARAGMRGAAAAGHAARLEMEEAQLLAALGAADEALDAARRALPALDAAQHAWECARAEGIAARALLALGRAEEAAQAADRAAQRWERLGNAELAAAEGLTAAAALGALGQLEPARARVERAAAVTDPVLACQARLAAARLSDAAGDRGGALLAVEAAVADARALAIAPLLAEALELRARLIFDAGDDARATADADEALRLTEALRGSLQALQLRGAVLGSRAQAGETLVRARLRAGDLPGAFAAAERMRSRALLDLLRGGVAALAPEDSARREALESQLNRLYAQLTTPPRPGERRLSLDAWRQELRAVERELDREHARSAPAAARACDAAEVRALLDPGEVMLQYHQAHGRIVAFVVTRDAPLAAADLCDASAAAAAVEHLGFLLRRPMLAGHAERAERMRREVDRALAALHAMLVAPLPEAAARAERWIAVMHGALHGAPLHALGAEGAACDRVVAYAPSASAFVARRTHARAGAEARADARPGAPARHGALVAAVADAFAPEIAREALAVADACRAAGLPTAALLDAQATAQALADQCAAAAVVHIATHGRFDAAHPRACGLRLADRWMNVPELARLPLRGARVLLSGCETGRVALGRGEEPAGILRALVEAGVADAVTTLWPAHDATSADLMIQLHRAVAASENAGDLARQLHRIQRDAHGRGVPSQCWAPFVALAR
ncbi:MAG: CHAT domain-containing protein [Phycisphaerales bacterium]